MRFEDMKKNIPETPQFIHTMIQSEVKKQMQDAASANIRTRGVSAWTGWKMPASRMAAAIAASVLATSSIAYAGAKVYDMFLEKQGNYGVTTKIKADGGNGEIALPEKIHDIDITAGYIPEGMEWTDESHLQYPEHGRRGGFSMASDLFLSDADSLRKAKQDKNVVECEERIFGSYEGIYLKYHDLTEDGSFNQRIYLLCPELYRVVTVYIGDDIAKEDAIKVAENLTITENDTMLETAGLRTWSDSLEEELGDASPASVAEEQLPVYQIGETFNLTASGEDNEGSFRMDNPISARVDSVRVEDNLRLLDRNRMPVEWADAVGADGKLAKNTLSYIKSGDGMDSVDEIVKTESVRQKLVYATVTYTNQSREEMRHMLYIGALVLMKQENGNYQIYDPAEQPGDGYDRVIWDGAAAAAEMKYSSISEDYGNGGNYIPSLKPGESIQVHMAWIVNENDLDGMYLNLDGAGEAYAFSDSMLNTGLVDIRRK